MTKLNYERLKERDKINYDRMRTPSKAKPDCARADRIYLTSTYAERDAVRTRGGRWDSKDKRWYITPQHNPDHFRPWLPPTP